MASKATIAGILAFLHELFPTREFSDRTLDAWCLVFDDEWTDAEFTRCAKAAAKEPGRQFFPAPGDISAHRKIPIVDADAVLRSIAKLGSHNPRQGWIYPNADRIREQLGDAIADAYLGAGGSLLFAQEDASGATITADIARRTFTESLTTAQARQPERPLLTAEQLLILPAPVETERVIPEVVERKVRLREIPTSVAGKVKISAEYNNAKEDFGREWALDARNAEAFKAIRAALDAKYAWSGGVPLRSLYIACADQLGFAPFDDWKKAMLATPPMSPLSAAIEQALEEATP